MESQLLIKYTEARRVVLECFLRCRSSYVGQLGAVDAPSPNQASVLPDGYTAFPGIEVAYKYSNYDVTWNEVQKECIEGGGYLAAIDSFEKIDYATGLKPRHFTLHVGLRQKHIPWASTSYVEHESWLCTRTSAGEEGLIAYSCDKEREFICEIPSPVD